MGATPDGGHGETSCVCRPPSTLDGQMNRVLSDLSVSRFKKTPPRVGGGEASTTQAADIKKPLGTTPVVCQVGDRGAAS